MSRTARLYVAAAGATLALSACDLPSFGLDQPATEQGRRALSLWKGTVLTALVVGGVVIALILFTVVRFRRRSDEIPTQRAHNVPIEVVYTAIPVLIVAGLFGFNIPTQLKITRVSARPDVRVEVVGFQWQWEFRYPGEGITVTGTPDAAPPELVLPVGRTTQLELVANDVIHSFWVPEFLGKRDLIPGVENTVDVTPRRTGTFVGRCAEFCGLDHWRMRFQARVVTEREFERWVRDQQANEAISR